MTLTYAEFCAGAGGLGMAVEDVFGAELRWYSEFEAAPSAVMAHHWPGVPNHGDMTTIDFTTVESVDILSGWTPCQDLSHAGRRAGMRKGTRSGLWESMREAIATIKPTYVVWENVRGAYSAGADSSVEQCPGCMGEARDGEHFLRALGRVLGDLSDLGYDTQWRGLRASDVGAPHGRFRVFVLAERRDATGDTEGVRMEGHRTGGVEVAHAPAGTELLGCPGGTTAGGSNTPANADRVGREDLVLQPGEGASVQQPIQHGKAGTTAEVSPTPQADDQRGDRCGERASQDRRGQPAHGGHVAAQPTGDAGRIQHRDHGTTDWGPYAPAIHRWESRLGRRAPAPTELTAKGKHRLNARFAEWMMGWPAGWVDLPGISRNDQLKIIGNGVVPQQAAAALAHMLTTTKGPE